MSESIQPFRVAFVVGVTVSKWSAVWRERRPENPLELIPTDDSTQVSVLRSGEAQVAFVRLPVDDDGLNVIPLYAETAHVVVARDHPIALFEAVVLADLDDENRLTGAADDSIALVAAGIGVTILPQSIARLHGRKDVVSRPVTDGLETTIGLAWRADAADDRTEEFIGIVRGRTAHSSRGTSLRDERPTPAKRPKRETAPKPGPRGGPRRRSR